jgi:hypothetical protein
MERELLDVSLNLLPALGRIAPEYTRTRHFPVVGEICEFEEGVELETGLKHRITQSRSERSAGCFRPTTEPPPTTHARRTRVALDTTPERAGLRLQPPPLPKRLGCSFTATPGLLSVRECVTALDDRRHDPELRGTQLALKTLARRIQQLTAEGAQPRPRDRTAHPQPRSSAPRPAWHRTTAGGAGGPRLVTPRTPRQRSRLRPPRRRRPDPRLLWPDHPLPVSTEAATANSTAHCT